MDMNGTGKEKYKFYMKLDVFKKASSLPATKSRTMYLISKIGIIYRVGRITKGLFLVLFFAYLFYMGMHKDAKLDFTLVIVLYVLISTIAFLFLLSGVRRLFNTISIIEYGILASATVSGYKEWKLKRRLWAGPGTIGGANFYTTHKRGCIICKYTDTSGKSHSFDVFFHNDEDQIKKGDIISVIYDSGMPENALAVDALPWFMKTVPAL